jgi:hypothetical protein
MEEPAERRGRFGLSAPRAIAGVLALALVVVLEVERRRDEPRRPMPPSTAAAASSGPPLASVPVAPTLPPAPPASSPPPVARRAAAPASSPAPAPRPQPTPAPARLAVDFEHGFKAGSLAVFVDGRRVLDEPLRSRPAGKFLIFERREGRITRTLPVAPGRRTVLVRVRWEDNQRSETTVARFREGRARTLVARLKPVTRSLSLQWR